MENGQRRAAPEVGAPISWCGVKIGAMQQIFNAKTPSRKDARISQNPAPRLATLYGTERTRPGCFDVADVPDLQTPHLYPGRPNEHFQTRPHLPQRLQTRLKHREGLGSRHFCGRESDWENRRAPEEIRGREILFPKNHQFQPRLSEPDLPLGAPLARRPALGASGYQADQGGAAGSERKTVDDPAFSFRKAASCNGNRLVMEYEYRSVAD